MNYRDKKIKRLTTGEKTEQAPVIVKSRKKTK
jgi:hypothetical protein